ncbi:MAG: phosphotransacetylase family protein [Chloroflexota bacterium]
MSKILYVVSTGSYTGKSAVSLALALGLREKGYNVRYQKPVGASLMRFGDQFIDEDAYVAWSTLGIDLPWDLSSPVLLTEATRNLPLSGPVEGLLDKIAASLEIVRKGQELVIMEGLARTFDGISLGLSAPEIAEKINASVLAVIGYRRDLDPDSIMISKRLFKDRLVGVVVNGVPSRLLDTVQEELQPYCERISVPLIGVFPRDRVLRSITVGELAEELGGEVLCAEDKLDELVETVALGAMTGDAALRFFQGKSNKAVITGGDRSDVILAALRTSTKCLILTGNLRPAVRVLSAAADRCVPVILVKTDTLTTTELVDRAVGHVRLSSPKQIARLKATISDYRQMIDGIEAILEL